MNIEAGQIWSIPPHGPDVHVHAAATQELAEPVISYSVGGRNGGTYEKPLSAFVAAMTRLSARRVP